MGFPGPLLADGYAAAGDEHTIHMYILDVTEGWLGPQPVLANQPVGDDPHVPLSHGAHLLHVVGKFDPLERAHYSCGPTPNPAFLLRPGSAHIYHQPHLDAQKDHAAAQPRGLELWKQTGTRQWIHTGPVRGFCQTPC